ncbi:MAG TPA: c-type cytochrome [Terriglobia bacterium]|nr:c-type cytochrome [Terriglobia bacterium]
MMRLRIVPVLAVAVASLAFGTLSFAAGASSDTAQLFQSKCSMCHGKDGKGFPAIHTPDFTSPKWQAATSDKLIKETITNGKKGTAMPAFSNKLKPEQIDALAKYIRTFNSAKK